MAGDHASQRHPEERKHKPSPMKHVPPTWAMESSHLQSNLYRRSTTRVPEQWFQGEQQATRKSHIGWPNATRSGCHAPFTVGQTSARHAARAMISPRNEALWGQRNRITLKLFGCLPPEGLGISRPPCAIRTGTPVPGPQRVHEWYNFASNIALVHRLVCALSRHIIPPKPHKQQLSWG